ncbi:thioredoxin family protein [Patescibacteria group bacterium]|nr:thioredoxin family protein [Patescibacteria group bacterium]
MKRMAGKVDLPMMLARSNKTVLLVTSLWRRCSLCVEAEKLLDELSQAPQFYGVVFLAILADNNHDWCRQQDVCDTPTVIVFSGSEEVGRSEQDEQPEQAVRRLCGCVQ